MNRLLALIMLCGALALPALPVHADATDDLFKAAWYGTASEVKAALAAGADPGAHEDSLGDTPLHRAARDNSNPSVIKALIEGGADLGARNRRGFTPLHRAARNANPSVITALIEAGADPGARGGIGGVMPLHGAAALSINPSVIKALIEGGADPGARAKDGFTPLHFAAIKSAIPSVILALIEAGADPAARDDAGKTPFDYAKNNEDLKGTDAYWLLNERGADNTVSADACQIEDWRWRYVELLKAVSIEGTTTCETGKITIRAYDGNGEFIGVGKDFIEDHVFKIGPIMGILQKPRSLEIKSTIKRNP